MGRVVFGQKQPRRVHVAAADMRVDIDGAGHDDATGSVNGRVRLSAGGWVDDPAIRDPEIAHATAAADGIDDVAAGYAGQHGKAYPAEMAGDHAKRQRCRGQFRGCGCRSSPQRARARCNRRRCHGRRRAAPTAIVIAAPPTGVAVFTSATSLVPLRRGRQEVSRDRDPHMKIRFACPGACAATSKRQGSNSGNLVQNLCDGETGHPSGSERGTPTAFACGQKHDVARDFC